MILAHEAELGLKWIDLHKLKRTYVSTRLYIVVINFIGTLVGKELERKYLKHKLLRTSE